MKKSALKIAATCLLSFVLICSFLLSAVASGYDAYTARKSIASEKEIVSIWSYQSGDDVSKNLYGIYNADDLVEFARLVNTYDAFRSQEIHVCLCASIDMSSIKEFTPIGSGMTLFNLSVAGKSFGGTFDGRGYMIDNLTTASCSYPSREIAYVSLFGCLKSTAHIQNLVIGSGCNFTYDGNYENACVAPLAARVEEGAEIKNILNLASVSGGVYCGGLVARVDGSARKDDVPTANISDCTNNGSVNGSYSGGLVGSVRGNLSIKNCTVRGDVTAVPASDHAGGAIGIAAPNNITGSASTDVSVALNSITVECTLTGSSDDKIVGNADSVSLTKTKCTFSEEKHAEIGVRFHGIQLAEKDGVLSIRFIASLDRETNYSEAGFLISANGSNLKNLSCKTLFTSLLGQDGGDPKVYTVDFLRGDDGYLFAATIHNIPIAIDNQISFAIQAYVSGETTETYRFTLERTEGGYTVTWND